MNSILFPRPRQMQVFDEKFTFFYPLNVALPQELESLSGLLEETLGCEILITDMAQVIFVKDIMLAKEAYRIEITTDKIIISYSASNGAYYALTTLGQMIRGTSTELPCCKISDEPELSVRGYMLDISRGKVPTLNDLCSYVRRLAKLKCNQLQLYVEGFSFAYPSYPEVWKDKTPLTGEEIQYLDAYCKARFIELVPNQNSLGHMTDWIAREEFHSLSESEDGMSIFGAGGQPGTLDAMDPRSLELVTSMIDDMIPFFSSDKFNVNMDEPFELGKGKNKALAEEKGEDYIYINYMERLHETLVKRGKKMYMWGDILTNHTEHFEKFPKDITVLDWGYEHYFPFEEHAAILEEKEVKFISCPGTSVWTSVTGRTDNMFGNILNAATAAIKHHGVGLLLTAWGDGGHLEYEPLNEAAMAYAAACSWGCLDTTEDEVAEYLNKYAFFDKSEKAAQFLLELGRCYHYEEFPMLNMTVASLNLMVGTFPEGVFPAVMDQTVQGMLSLATPLYVKYVTEAYSKRKEFDYIGVCAHLEKLRKQLYEICFVGSDAEILFAEFENTFRMAEFTQKVHYLNASSNMNAEEREDVIQSIKQIGQKILETHSGLWIARNRIHGMEESVAGIRNILNQLSC